MSESPDNGFDFSLPEQNVPGRRDWRTFSPGMVLAVVVVMTLANILVTIVVRNSGDAGGIPTLVSSQSLKKMALKLEKQGLVEEAEAAWREYLSQAKADEESAAKIWYRLGKLYLEEGEPAKALPAFYRSEAIQELPELQTDLNRQVAESLEALGRFSALRHELSERVSLSEQGDGDVVVAEIGAEKITLADLDRRVEAQIERQLDLLGGAPAGEERKRQKDALVKQLGGGSQRLQFLQGMLAEELLYRKARESGLAQGEEVQRQLRQAERELLAGMVLSRRLEGLIQITPGDLETYYQAHRDRYVERGEGDEEGRQLEFDEVRERVYRELRAQKEAEIRDGFLQQLQREYDVVIHRDRLGGGNQEESP